MSPIHEMSVYTCPKQKITVGGGGGGGGGGCYAKLRKVMQPFERLLDLVPGISACQVATVRTTILLKDPKRQIDAN